MKIKLLVLDVDGTLTDAKVVYGSDGMEIKEFNTCDGLIIGKLPELGIKVIILTARECEAVTRRAKELNCEAFQGVKNKFSVLQEIITKYGISPEETAYFGDDINDYEAMSLCGFKACPSDAVTHIKAICDYVSDVRGGYGAVRDCAEDMLRRIELYDEWLLKFGIENKENK